MMDMTIHPIYANILFSPKVWGLKFSSMVACMLTLIVGFFVAGNLDLVTKFFFTLLISGVTFGLLYWKDNRDEVAHYARRNCHIKKVAAGYTISAQFVTLK